VLRPTPTIDRRTHFGLLPATTGAATLQPAVNFAPGAAAAHLLGQAPVVSRALRLTPIENANVPGGATLGTTTLRNIDTRLGATV
jgi:hypothetical protein